MPDFPSAVATLPPLQEQTQQDFLNLFDRILPDHYLAPIKDPGPGYEYLQSVAKMAARVSEAIQHVGTGNYILSATGGSYSTATIEFYRDTAVYGAITIKAGTRVATLYGRTYITQNDAVFTAADLGPHAVTVQAISPGWAWNLPGQFTRATGEVIPGSIDRMLLPIMEPAFGDPTIKLRQTTDATGGSAPMLDALGHDKGIDRQPGESDAQYRPRIAFLPDTVTPNALKHAASAYLRPFLEPLGKSYVLLETWEARYQTAYDFPPNITLSDLYSPDPPGPPATPLTFNGNVFVYDDPRPNPAQPLWYSDRYMDENDNRAAIVIGIPNLPCVADFGYVYDDTAANTNALLTPLGRRGLGAFDLPGGTLPSAVLQGCLDGADQKKQAVYSGLGAVLTQTKAAGVTIELVLEGQ